MIKLSSLKIHAEHFLLVYLFLSVLISLTLGSFDTVAEVKCEYEDANLIWRNISVYSLHDVKAMAWYKGKVSLIATWLEGKGFVEYPPYVGRLMQIGETGIKIKTANRSDSGTYWLSLTLASVDHKLEEATHLEVKVAPSSQCKPRITQEGSFIKADLPPEGCGIPHLTPKWKHSNRTIIHELQNSSSFLDLITNNPGPGEYLVCAEGESVKCYQGNISDLCKRHTIPTSDHGSTSAVGPIVFVILLFTTVVLAATVLVLCRHVSCRNIFGGREENKSNDFEMSTNEDAAMESLQDVQPKTKTEKELPEIQKHLRQLYEGLITVPLSPSGEEEDHVNISELYVNIDFRKVEITDLDNNESKVFSDTPCEYQPLISKDQPARNKKNQFGPIWMFGGCGSGKSAWCKHLVECWLQHSDIKDANTEGLNLPDLRNIKILLYLPLQFSDRGISFHELLKKHLFKENSTCLEFLMKYVKRNAQDVLIIMDGLDIITENVTPISELLHDKLMSSCTVVVTSRPASLKLLQDTRHAKIEQLKLFRIREMTPEGSKAYASRFLESINRRHGKNLKFVNFWMFTKHLQVHSLLKVPYICLLLLHVWMKNKNCFIEVTDILFDIIYFYLHRAISDQQRKELIEKTFGGKSVDVVTYITKLNKWDLLMEHGYLLHVLSRVAAHIFTSQIEKKSSKLNVPKILSITDEVEHGLQVICETGLLTESLSLTASKNVSDLSFPNRIICEFFVSIFIALREGRDCDFIVSSGKASLQNSMIIHMLFQLSDTVVKDVMNNASTNLEKESTNTMGNEGRTNSNEKFRYSVTCRDSSPVIWLQWLMNNDALLEKKLLFLTTALHFIHTLTSLVLEIHENNKNLVFQLPLLSMLEILTLDITKCTLLLCKEWDNRVPSRLKEVVIKSVKVHTGTLGLLAKTLGLCAELERLELFPVVILTDDNDNLLRKSDFANFSWNELSKSLQNNKKLKTLELNSLTLVGVVDTLLSRFNRYESLESLKLKNLSNILQEQLPLFHSPGIARGNAHDDVKQKNRIKLTQLSLEKLKLLYSPIDFLFDKTKKGEQKAIENNFKLLSISALEMPEKSWETLGNQISTLTLSEFHLNSVNPRGSLQILLDGIGKCKTLECLSLCKIDTGNITPNFSFLAKMKELSQLQLGMMKLAGSSSHLLFGEICGCKQLQTLSLCNIDVEEIPETLRSVRKLKKLSKLIVDNVTIKGGRGSLSDFLSAFGECENLKNLHLNKENAVSIPSKLSAAMNLIKFLDIE